MEEVLRLQKLRLHARYLGHIHIDDGRADPDLFFLDFDLFLYLGLDFGLQRREVLDEVVVDELVDELPVDVHLLCALAPGTTWHHVPEFGSSDFFGAVPALEAKHQREGEHLLLQVKCELVDFFEDVLVAAHARVAARLQLLDQFEDVLALAQIHWG